MKPVRKTICRRVAAFCAAGVLAAPAHAAGEGESLEMLRETTLNLINVLVDQGVMTREKADALIKAAERKAAETVAAREKEAPTAAAEAGPKGRIRVAFVPESVKNELREQIRQDVLAQAKTERWGDPGALPDWLDRISWEGDMRLRYQSDVMGRQNAPASDYVTANWNFVPTRMADFGGLAGNANTANTLEDRERYRLRLRLGMNARISEDFRAGVRLATGSATDRVSTNQSLGNDFNKYTVSVDRAFLKYEPNDWISVSGGRIPNPWFSTDLVWDENLNFEGFAATFGHRLANDPFKPFLTMGYFPLREDTPPTRNRRGLYGAQAGFQWDLNSRTRLKLGGAVYNYANMEGQLEDANAYISGFGQQTSNYGQYQYESGLRQKGNTLFATNFNTGDTAPIWGLASRFREVNLTAALDLAHWDPFHIILIGDYVKNVAFDKNEIFRRTGLDDSVFPDGGNHGYQVKLQIGAPQVKSRYDWNASIAYRYLGSDAVLDAFTSSDFGLGGTNNKGYIFAFNYGVDRNVSVGLRLLSSDSIDATIPAAVRNAAGYGFSSSKPRYSVDTVQVDLNASF